MTDPRLSQTVHHASQTNQHFDVLLFQGRQRDDNCTFGNNSNNSNNSNSNNKSRNNSTFGDNRNSRTERRPPRLLRLPVPSGTNRPRDCRDRPRLELRRAKDARVHTVARCGTEVVPYRESPISDAPLPPHFLNPQSTCEGTCCPSPSRPTERREGRPLEPTRPLRFPPVEASVPPGRSP